MQLNRQLTGIKLKEWHNLVSNFSTSPITPDDDKVVWRWNSLGLFTVHSLYKWLEYGGIKNYTYIATSGRPKYSLRSKFLFDF